LALRKTADPTGAVLGDAGDEIGGDAYVERSVLPVAHHVDGDESLTADHGQGSCSWVAGTSPAMTYLGIFGIAGYTSPLV